MYADISGRIQKKLMVTLGRRSGKLGDRERETYFSFYTFLIALEFRRLFTCYLLKNDC